MTQDRVILALTSPRPSTRARLVRTARQLGFRAFVGPTPLLPRPGEEWFAWRRGALVTTAGTAAPPRPVRVVRTPKDLSDSLAGTRASSGLVIRWLGDRVIPLETVVADDRSRGRVWVAVDRPQELSAALGALERGAERVILPVAGPGDLRSVRAMLEPASLLLRWTQAPVVDVRPVGTAERVIVDTTSLLGAREGLLVGSAARLLFHVNSEATGSSFSAPRPFRVNAGSPHLYVLMADGSTRYLAELAPGDRVACARPRGSARAVRVGRLKIERRPMVMIVAGAGADRTTVFVQEAETVRLSTGRGATAVTELKARTRLLGVRLPPARHLGRSVDETIEER
jgi:3-dehydroquinate synthase II